MRPQPAGVSALPASLSPEPIEGGGVYISSAFDGDALCDSNPEASGKSVAVSENKRFEMRWLLLCWNLRTVERMLDSVSPPHAKYFPLFVDERRRRWCITEFISRLNRVATDDDASAEGTSALFFCPFTHD